MASNNLSHPPREGKWLRRAPHRKRPTPETPLKQDFRPRSKIIGFPSSPGFQALPPNPDLRYDRDALKTENRHQVQSSRVPRLLSGHAPVRATPLPSAARSPNDFIPPHHGTSPNSTLAKRIHTPGTLIFRDDLRVPVPCSQTPVWERTCPRDSVAHSHLFAIRIMPPITEYFRNPHPLPSYPLRPIR